MLERAFSALTIKSIDEEKREIRGWATTPSPDRIGDIIEPFGLKYAKSIPLFLYHDPKMGVGHAELGRATKDGVPFVGRFPKVVESGRLKDMVDEAWQRVKYKLIAATSIGFKEVAGKVEQLRSGGLRYLEAEILELSLVPIPMNAEATIDSAKAIYKSIDAKDLRAALGREQGNRTNRPGAAGSRSEGTTMKTIEQRLQELQEQRSGHAARIKEIHEGCGGDFPALNKEDAAEFAELSRDLEKDDAEIANAKTVQRAIGTVVEAEGSSQQQGTRSRGGQPPEKEKETKPEDKGIAFAQFYKVKWLAKHHGVSALDIAAQYRNLDKRVPMLLKAAVSSGSVSSGGGNWGSQLVGAETGVVADFYEFLRPQTILGKFGTNEIPSLNRVPFRVPLVGMTDGGSGYWVGEGKAKPVTAFAFERNTTEPLKVAAICVVTRELLLDSSPSADTLLRNALAKALRERTDIDFVDPAKAAVAGVSPASITNGVTPISAAGTGTAANIRTDVAAAFDAFIAANNQPLTAVWIMSASTALKLSMMQNALGQAEHPGISMKGGEFAGLPVIVSQYVVGGTAGYDVILVNAEDVYFSDDGDVIVDTSEHASIEMSDNPEGEVGTVVSMYQTNRVAFRAERRLDWLKRRSSSVQLISGANWGEA